MEEIWVILYGHKYGFAIKHVASLMSSSHKTSVYFEVLMRILIEFVANSYLAAPLN